MFRSLSKSMYHIDLQPQVNHTNPGLELYWSFRFQSLRLPLLLDRFSLQLLSTSFPTTAQSIVILFPLLLIALDTSQLLWAATNFRFRIFYRVFNKLETMAFCSNELSTFCYYNSVALPMLISNTIIVLPSFNYNPYSEISIACIIITQYTVGHYFILFGKLESRLTGTYIGHWTIVPIKYCTMSWLRPGISNATHFWDVTSLSSVTDFSNCYF